MPGIIRAAKLLLPGVWLLFLMQKTPANAGVVGQVVDPAVQIKSAIAQNHKVCFSLEELDWKELAKKHFKIFNPDNLGPKQIELIQKNRSPMGSFSDFSFAAPLPDWLKRKNVYSISDAGVAKLTLARLKGTLRIFLDEKSEKIADSLKYGEVETSTSQENCGFVFLTAKRLRFQIKFLKEGELTVQKLENNVQEIRIAGLQPIRIERPIHPPQIITAFSFIIEPTKDEYLFVHWAGDTDCQWTQCCSSQYDLFRIQKGSASPASQNYYDCKLRAPAR